MRIFKKTVDKWLYFVYTLTKKVVHKVIHREKTMVDIKISKQTAQKTVDLMKLVYLPGVVFPGYKACKVDIGLLSNKELGSMLSAWDTLGNKKKKSGNYTIVEGLKLIVDFMILKDYEKVMNLFYSNDVSAFRSPLVVVKGSDKSKSLIYDGNHRACAFYKMYLDKKTEVFIPVIKFTFQKIKNPKGS